MLPLTPYTTTEGPFRATYIRPGGSSYHYTVYLRKDVGFKQLRPYDVNTIRTLRVDETLYGVTNANSWAWKASNLTAAVIAENKARAKFVSELGDGSQFGSTLTTERRATFTTVVDIVTNVAKAARHIRRLEFLSAASILGLPYNQRVKKGFRKREVYISRKNGLGSRRIKVKVPYQITVFSFGTGREYVKSLASGWLMWSYGVKPLMDDIYRGVDSLQRPLISQKVKGYGRAVVVRHALQSGKITTTFTEDVKVRCSAYVSVSNPNLWLANKLGLVNPIQMINEGIPFSFVVDWFSNLSPFINQMTDFVGLTIQSPCMTKTSVGTETSLNASWSKKHTIVERTLSLPVVKLRFAFERFELQRGLNAISLLVGFLPKK